MVDLAEPRRLQKATFCAPHTGTARGAEALSAVKRKSTRTAEWLVTCAAVVEASRDGPCAVGEAYRAI